MYYSLFNILGTPPTIFHKDDNHKHYNIIHTTHWPPQEVRLIDVPKNDFTES